MKKLQALLAVLAILAPDAALAADADVMAALDSMKRQMAAMQQTIDAQSARIADLESRLAEKPSPDVRLDAAAQPDAKKEYKRGVEEAMPWLKGLKMGGDLRLRAEYMDFFDKDNDAGSTGTANDRSRARYRFRLRWGVEKEFEDGFKVGFRLASATSVNGQAVDNTSTNVTLGNPGYFTYKNIFIDRAFAEYSPAAWKDKGALKSATIGAGKFDNPFLRYSTGVVWDNDVTPEGLYERANFSLASTDKDKLGAQVTLGQFLANENAGVETDAQVYGYQAALTWSTDRLGGRPADLAFAASYYDYPNWFQTVASNTAGVSFLRTNTTALDDPRVLDLYGEAVFHWGKTPLTLWGDFVENTGEIDPFRETLSEVHGDDTAWALGFKVGKTKKRADWEIGYGYYEVGANAVVAAYNDSDLGQGFTNRMGHRLAVSYQITDSLVFSWTNMVFRPVHAAPSSVVASSLDEAQYRSQADLVWKF